MRQRFVAWVYRNFTWARWRSSPFQMYSTAFLLVVSSAQMALGISPSLVFSTFDSRTQLSLALCNYVGAAITIWGLHLKSLETALWVELSGYICLVFVLGLYVILLSHTQELAQTTYGFAFSEAFIFAAFHRAAQIFLYKRRRRQVLQLRRELGIETAFPSDPIEGDLDGQ